MAGVPTGGPIDDVPPPTDDLGGAVKPTSADVPPPVDDYGFDVMAPTVDDTAAVATKGTAKQGATSDVDYG